MPKKFKTSDFQQKVQEDQSEIGSNQYSNSDEDSDENIEGEQMDGYQLDDFVVADDSENDDLDEGGDNQQKQKKKKRRLVKEVDLDEDDLDLVAEMDQGNKKHKRLKKVDDRGSESNDDFIERNELVQDRQQRSKPQINQKLGELHNFFVGDNQDEDQLELEDINIKKKKYISEVYEPAELEERFALPEDHEIRDRDIPERLQLRYKNRAQNPNNKELVDETKWIFEMMNIQFRDPTYAENFQKKILKVLEFYRIQNYEFMFLHCYRKPELYPDLSLNDLQEIYDLDQEWGFFYQFKEQNIKDFNILEEHMKIPLSVNEMLKVCTEKEYLQYLSDYSQFHISKFIDVNSQVAENQIFKKPLRKVFAREAAEQRLDQFSQIVGLTADELAENLLNSGKNDENQEFHRPRFVALTPEKVADEYIDGDSALTLDSLTTLTNLCKYMALELFYHPVIRSWVRRLYYEYVSVTTEPTLKGSKELTANTYHYCVKRVQQRPIKEFRDELWLLMLHNEREGQIRVRFQLPWESNISSKRKELQEFKDEIYLKIKDFYIAQVPSEFTEENKQIMNQWNIVRAEVLKQYLRDFMYPSLERSIREELTRKSEKYVTKICGQKFKEILNTSPYMAELDNIQKAYRKARVIGVVYDQTDQSIAFASVDQNGNLSDYLILKYYGLSNGADHQDIKIKQHYYEDENLIKNQIKNFQPDLIVVSTNGIDARRIRQKLQNTRDELVLAMKNEDENNEIKKPHIAYGDYLVPQLYSKTQKSIKQYPGLKQSVKEALSMARFRQNPLAEVLNIWHDKNQLNAVFYIPVHYLQHMISTQKLRQEYEKVAVEVVNTIGLDINSIIKNEHLQNQLQFVCGLGPRKAQHIIESIQHNSGNLRFRMELWGLKIIDKNIYMNCIGFLKVENENEQIDDKASDTLDTTRIHPENYTLAKKIAKDALDDDVDDDKDGNIIRIIQDPTLLDDLDLEDYADHLAQVKLRPNMIYLLRFIVEELTSPFKDPRKKNLELSDEDLFYKLCKENPMIFRRFTLVNAKVIKVLKQNLICKIIDNNLTGSIFKEDIFDRNQQVNDLSQKFSEGDIFKARVKKIDYVNFKVDLTIKERDLKINENMLDVDMFGIEKRQKERGVEKNHSFSDITVNKLWKNVKDYFLIKEQEDFPQFQEVQKMQIRYIPRKINHPKFKNISIGAAIEFLQDKPVGDYIFRPSSKSTDYLNLTWKFYDNSILHLLIKEDIKAPNALIGKKLYMGKDQFDSLDEIIDKYIIPCNQLMKAASNHKKFLSGEMDFISEILTEDRRNDQKHIPYYIGCIESAPQYIVLCYIPKGNDIIKEYVKVKHNGLFFHGYVFTSVNMLISWFKENFKTPEYQRYLRKVKAPFDDKNQDQIRNMVSEQRFMGESPGMIRSQQSPGYAGIKQENVRIKDEVKREDRFKVCNTCGQTGHMANQCPNDYGNQRYGESQSRGASQSNHQFKVKQEFPVRQKGYRERSRSNSRDRNKNFSSYGRTGGDFQRDFRGENYNKDYQKGGYDRGASNNNQRSGQNERNKWNNERQGGRSNTPVSGRYDKRSFSRQPEYKYENDQKYRDDNRFSQTQSYNQPQQQQYSNDYQQIQYKVEPTFKKEAKKEPLQEEMGGGGTGEAW